MCTAISSCSARYTPTDESVAVKKETKKMLQSKAEKMGGLKVGDLTYYFILNENNSFAAIVDMDDTKRYDFCAGTFQNVSDTINLSYYNNYKSKYFTDKVIIDNKNKEIVFLNADFTENKRIKLLDIL